MPGVSYDPTNNPYSNPANYYSVFGAPPEGTGDVSGNTNSFNSSGTAFGTGTSGTPWINPGGYERTQAGSDYFLGYNNGAINLGAPGVSLSTSYLPNQSLMGSLMDTSLSSPYLPTSSLGSIFGNVGGFLNDPSQSLGSAYDYLTGLPGQASNWLTTLGNDPRSGLGQFGDLLNGGFNLFGQGATMFGNLFGGDGGAATGTGGTPRASGDSNWNFGSGGSGGGLSGLLSLLAAGGVGALNGFGTQSGVTTTSQAPWLAQQPYLMRGYDQASQLLNKGPQQFFPGQQVAGQSADTTGSQGMLRTGVNQATGNFDQLGQYLTGMATGAKPTIGAKTDYGQDQLLRDTIGGKFLDPATNPYLQKTFDLASRNVQNATDNQFGMAGRYSSENGPGGAYAHAAMTGQGDLATKLFGGAYADERGIQNDALKTALGYNVADTARDVAAGNLDLAGRRSGMDAVGAYANLNDSRLRNFDALNKSGQQQDIYDQRLIDAEKEKFDFGQNAPYEAIKRYMASIGGPTGSETSTPWEKNKTAETIGLIAQLLGLGGRAFA